MLPLFCQSQKGWLHCWVPSGPSSNVWVGIAGWLWLSHARRAQTWTVMYSHVNTHGNSLIPHSLTKFTVACGDLSTQENQLKPFSTMLECLGRGKQKKAYPWQLMLLLFQWRDFCIYLWLKDWLPAGNPHYPSESRYKSTVYQPCLRKGFVWDNLYTGARTGNPVVKGLIFWGSHRSYLLEASQKACALVHQDVVCVSCDEHCSALPPGALHVGRGADFHSPLAPSAWLQGCGQPHNDTCFPPSAWPAKCIHVTPFLCAGLKRLQLCRAKQSPRCYQKH